MSEVSIVDLRSIPYVRGRNFSSKYDKYINAALNMPRGSAVCVEIDGLKNLYSSVFQTILARKLADRLATTMRGGKTYIIHAEDK